MTLSLALLFSIGLAAAAETPPLPPDPAAILRQVAGDVERIRGLKFKKQVPMEVVGDEATRKHALQRLEDLQAKDALDRELEVYRILKMVPEGDVMESVLGALEAVSYT